MTGQLHRLKNFTWRTSILAHADGAAGAVCVTPRVEDAIDRARHDVRLGASSSLPAATLGEIRSASAATTEPRRNDTPSDRAP